MKNLTKVIDDLGALRAQIAELTAKEKAIKDSLGDLKAGAYEGDLFRLTISDSVRETLDMTAVREKLSRRRMGRHEHATIASGLAGDRVRQARGVRNGKAPSESTAIEEAVSFDVAGQPDAVVAPCLVLRQLHLLHGRVIALTLIRRGLHDGSEVVHVLQQVLNILFAAETAAGSGVAGD